MMCTRQTHLKSPYQVTTIMDALSPYNYVLILDQSIAYGADSKLNMFSQIKWLVFANLKMGPSNVKMLKVDFQGLSQIKWLVFANLKMGPSNVKMLKVDQGLKIEEIV